MRATACSVTRRRGLLLLAFACFVILGLSLALPLPSAQTISGDRPIVGTLGDDELVGTDGNDVIDALDGNDVVSAGKGVDSVLAGGPGDDIVRLGGGGHTLEYRPRWDKALGGQGADTIYGNDGRDDLFGGAGADELRGGRGDDLIDGGTGDDRVTGGQGDDVALPMDGADVVALGDGYDFAAVSADGERDHIDCGPGLDLVERGGRGDPLDSFEGCETILGPLPERAPSSPPYRGAPARI